MVKTFKHYTDDEIQKNLNIQKEHWENNFKDFCQIIGIQPKTGDEDVFLGLFVKSIYIRELQLEQTKRLLQKSFTSSLQRRIFTKLKWILVKNQIKRFLG